MNATQERYYYQVIQLCEDAGHEVADKDDIDNYRLDNWSVADAAEYITENGL